MASLSTNKDGFRRIVFTGADDVRRTIYLGEISKKAAELIQGKVESLITAATSNVSPDREVAEWLRDVKPALYKKLVAVGLATERVEPERLTLGAFLDSFIAERSDVKGSTSTVYGHTRRCLINFFGRAKALDAISPGDADDWRRYLGRSKKDSKRPTDKSVNGEGLADNTVKRRCGIARQFFRTAKRRKLIAENPFADMKGVAVGGNRSREFFVTKEMAAKVLRACPDAQWRLLFALSRFGGLRCPSEHLGLRWADIDWARNRFTVRSPKTEHHEGHESRVVPLFPELRPYLEAVSAVASKGDKFVITRYRDVNSNLRTQLKRIITKAGLTSWPKLFQNLRATRQTELSEIFPAHVVCRWLGNSLAVAGKHYLQVTDEHFDLAAGKTTRQTTRSGAECGELEQTGADDETQKARETDDGRDFSGFEMGGTGLEPVTSTV
jgi:integrase